MRVCVKDPAYVVFRDTVIKKEVLNKVKGKLMSIQKYGEARRIIEEFGLPKPDEVLAHLGFTVQWKGLDVSAATIA